MTIKQISIFIENKSGTILKVLNVLKEANIQIIASSISDTVKYGIYRIICDKPVLADKLLKENGISAITNDVFAIELDDTPGQAASAIQYFAEAGINISYMYSFLVGNKGILILRTNDTEKTQEIIKLKKLKSYDLA
jgi:hypothetical protein